VIQWQRSCFTTAGGVPAGGPKSRQACFHERSLHSLSVTGRRGNAESGRGSDQISVGGDPPGCATRHAVLRRCLRDAEKSDRRRDEERTPLTPSTAGRKAVRRGVPPESACNTTSPGGRRRPGAGDRKAAVPGFPWAAPRGAGRHLGVRGFGFTGRWGSVRWDGTTGVGQQPDAGFGFLVACRNTNVRRGSCSKANMRELSFTTSRQRSRLRPSTKVVGLHV